MSKKAIIFSIIAAVVVAVSTVVPVAVVYGGGHKHDVSTEWQYDETSHWHVCEGGDCQEHFDVGEHIFVNTTDKDIPATTESEGKDYKVCLTCHYETFDVIPKITGAQSISLSEFDQRTQEASAKYIEDNTYETYANKCLSFVFHNNIETTQILEYYESEEAAEDPANLKKGPLTMKMSIIAELKITRIGQGVDTMFKIERKSSMITIMPNISSSTKVLTLVDMKVIENTTYYIGRRFNVDTQSYEYLAITQMVEELYAYNVTTGEYVGEDPNTTNTYQTFAEETPGEVPADFVAIINSFSNEIDNNIMTNFFDVATGSGSGSSIMDGFNEFANILGININITESAQKENDVYTYNCKGTSAFILIGSDLGDRVAGSLDVNFGKSYDNNSLKKAYGEFGLRISNSTSFGVGFDIEYLDEIESFELPEITDDYVTGTISSSNLFDVGTVL
ncbi:MAG: hypothetical protein ACI4R8_03520 [Candidatus Caccovivens sp.]